MRHLVLATAVLAAVAPPASAVPPPSGVSCTMRTTSDPGDPFIQSGSIWAGPVIADPAIGPVSIRCSVQYGPDLGEGGVAVAMSPFGNPAVLLPTPVTYPASPGQDIYLCTEYLDTNGGYYPYDADPTMPGEQCAKAQRTESGSGQTYTVLHSQKCVLLDPPLPPSSICVPWPDPIPWPFETR